MKKLNFFTILFLLFFLNTAYANNTDRIAFIDLDSILKNSNLGKSVIQEIEVLNNKNISKLKKKEIELKKNEDEILSKQNILSEEESKKEVEILKEKIKKYRSLKNEMVLSYEKKREDSLKKFFDQINPIIQNYMNDNSINILLERKNVFIGKNNSDITASIIKEINKKF